MKFKTIKAYPFYLIFMTILASLLLVLTTRVIDWIGGYDKSSFPPVSFVIFISYSVFAILIFVGLGIIKLKQIALKEIGWSKFRLLQDGVIGIVGFFLVSACLIGFLSLFGAWDLAEFVVYQSQIPWSYRFLFLLIGIHAALIEESFFRGVMQPYLVKNFGSFVGVMFTAIIFSIYHLAFMPMALVGRFTQGFVYGWAKQMSGSLHGPFLAHVLVWLLWGFY